MSKRKVSKYKLEAENFEEKERLSLKLWNYFGIFFFQVYLGELVCHFWPCFSENLTRISITRRTETSKCVWRYILKVKEEV